jgi:hypothetical protein
MLENDEFEEVSSPVAGWTSIRLFLALTTLYNILPLQLDINLAYLNAPGSKAPPGLVWKLEKVSMVYAKVERTGTSSSLMSSKGATSTSTNLERTPVCSHASSTTR